MKKRKRNASIEAFLRDDGRNWKVAKIKLRDITPPAAGDLFAPPRDDSLVALIERAEAGELPTSRMTVPLAALTVHDPPVLEKIRAHLREEPSTRNAIVQLMLDERPALIVYRNDAGQLVMFDDYVKYSVAVDMGLREVHVQIIHESLRHEDGLADA
jgi:hypothetical protein